MTDYTTMEGPEFLQVCGDDARKWAIAFCQAVNKLGTQEIDIDWMTTWFANAIENSCDVRRQRGENDGQ